MAEPISHGSTGQIDRREVGLDEGDSSDNEEKYRLHVTSARPRPVSDRKRVDTEIFKAWIARKQTQPSTPSTQKSSSSSCMTDTLSKELLAGAGENQRIIHSPREYQVELFERAKEENSIIVLDTGSGKTLIAALLLRHVLEKELEDRAAGNPKRVAFFLVEKVALVFQQFSVLECNLNFPMARFCGEMVDRNDWSKAEWTETFEKNMLVVCTAAILQKCLAHSFINLQQINLLIFDEAHHAKKNHPYARIVKDYYLREPDEAKRPRILGMTASPVDAQTDYVGAAHMLEAMLCSRIITVPDGTLADSILNCHQETRAVYDKLARPVETDLHSQLRPLVRHFPDLAKLSQYALLSSSDLGVWCSDRLWQVCLTDGEMARLIARAETKAQKALLSPSRTEEITANLREVKVLVDGWEFQTLERSLEHLSPKTMLLFHILHEYFSAPKDHRCIVFVSIRHTAMLLNDLFQQAAFQISGLQSAVLVGTRNDVAISNMSLREQLLTLRKFKDGSINCLFASSVAEEGIDIPDCDLVIRFDLYNSTIQYIQSRGRARIQGSKFVSMLERGNTIHLRKFTEATQEAGLLRAFCAQLPPDRKLQLNLQASLFHNEIGKKHLVIKSTGAKLTFTHSLEVLANFVAHLPHDGEDPLPPEYLITHIGREYVCQVLLPASSPIQAAKGTPQTGKRAAKCAAAFEACRELLRVRALDDYLQPTFRKKLPAMRNARLAISANKRAKYNMRLKPMAWSRVGIPAELFAAVCTLNNPDVLGRPSSPFILLTREPMPTMQNFSLYFGGGQNSPVHIVNLAEPLNIAGDEDRLGKLTALTLRVFDDVFSKNFIATADMLPYFLAPCVLGHEADFNHTSPMDAIDWDVVKQTAETDFLSLEDSGTTAALFYRDRFVIDPWDGGRKLYTEHVRDDLKPSDPVPDHIPPPRYREWKNIEHNIKEYSISLWGSARARRQWSEDQPVVEAHIVSLRRNLLDDFAPDTDDEVKEGRCFVIMEPLKVSTLPTRLVATLLTLPAIIHRIESTLIALDGCTALGLTVRPSLALQAMTKDSDNTEEHGEAQINHQPGMGPNYERLEFLGDTFLKMATTLALYTQLPASDEFEYHVERMVLVCNRNLFNTAVDKGLAEFIRCQAFSRRTWYPLGIPLRKGKAPKDHASHDLADKSIADVCEALIGASYLSGVGGKERNFDMAIRAVTAVVNNKKHRMVQFSDYHASYQVPPWQTAAPTAAQRMIVDQVREKTGYKFQWPTLLRSAFKHPSYPYETMPHYQRLEFLGDSLLDLVCVDYLFDKFPEADPQWLTEHKMAMVSNLFLGCLCVDLGFHRHLLSLSAVVINSIKTYADDLSQAAEVGTSNYWVDVKQPPKCLADVVEAYVGAMFVDSGYDYSRVQEFFQTHMVPYFEDMSLYDTFASRHPVTALSKLLQQELGCNEWRLMVQEVVPDEEAGASCVTESEVVAGIIVHGEVMAHAKAASGRYAKTGAAKVAMAVLKGMTRKDFRSKFRCGCVMEEDGSGGQESNE